MFRLFKKKQPFTQTSPEQWRDTWRGLVPPECRNVPVTLDGETVTAYILINHFAVMLQDGLLMERGFFDVCEHFQRAGYHVIWLMRCTQDVYNGYLKPGKVIPGVANGPHTRRYWSWKKPTTNFDHWISDNCDATILIQHAELNGSPITESGEQVLSRVTWATSNDPTRRIPGHTDFQTVDLPASPVELKRWLNGAALSKL